MPINYYTEDCDFRFRGKLRTSEWIRATAREEGFRTGNLSVVFCSDRALLKINREFLGHDYFTDIITFDYSEPERGVISGDLMISVDTVRSNAENLGFSFENELNRVIIHGILHLCGHGDKLPGEEAKMHALEDKYLARREERSASEPRNGGKDVLSAATKEKETNGTVTHTADKGGSATQTNKKKRR